MTRCLDAGTLRHLAEGALDNAAVDAAEAHVLACRHCAKALAALPVASELLNEIREMERVREELRPDVSEVASREGKLTTTLFGGDEGRCGT